MIDKTSHQLARLEIILDQIQQIETETVWNVARDYLGAVKGMAQAEITRAFNVVEDAELNDIADSRADEAVVKITLDDL